MQKSWKMLFITVAVCVVLASCGNYKFKPTTSYEIPDFEHIDHHGNEISLEQLKGKPWLAMFIFTNCRTICSPMTYNMTLIQEELKKQGIEDYNIVAFSVDPDNDTPEILEEYLSRYTVPDELKWHLLTGYDQTYIEQFALKSFKSIVKASKNDDQVIHANTFYLIDKNGIAVKNYTGYSETANGVPIDTIVMDMEALIDERIK